MNLHRHRLSFKREFVEPILAGSKTQTIRGRCHVSAGERVGAICQYHKPAFAELEVTKVEVVPIEVAEREWPDIRQTYDQDQVFKIHFRRV